MEESRTQRLQHLLRRLGQAVQSSVASSDEVRDCLDQLHEDGWRVQRTAGRAFRFERPDGRRLPEVPVRPEFADDAAEALERRQRDLDIDPWTPTTLWQGEPLDVDWALSTLHPAARQEWQPTPGAAGDVSAETSPGVSAM